MKDNIKKQLEKIEKQEKKQLVQKEKKGFSKKKAEWTEGIRQKIPEKVRVAVDAAFYKSFFLVFEKGTGVIEKTYDKEKLQWEHQFYDAKFTEKKSKKNFRKIEKGIQKSHRLHLAVTAAEGAGLGLLGIGLPDIPLFLGVLLQGIYETCVRYGYDYEKQEEKVYILQMIRGAMTEGAEQQQEYQEIQKMAEKLQKEETVVYDFQEEVKKTADVLSEAMLVAKFIQGLPLVGIAGSGYNVVTYHKIVKYCEMKYKRRYLMEKNMILQKEK